MNGRLCSLSLPPGENGCPANQFVTGGVLTGECLDAGTGARGNITDTHIGRADINITGPRGLCEVRGWYSCLVPPPP